MNVQRIVSTVIWAVVAGALLCACSSTGDGPAPAAPPSETASGAHSGLLGPDEFASAIAEPDRVTINVHVPYQGDIPGTDVSIPFDQIADQAHRLPSSKDAALAVYCRSGAMSATAAETLHSLGYTDVVDLAGGMKAWATAGRPLVGG
ncbi:rhodanese-like domain-containing protein [Mycobacterium sp. IDR2000157661]|uniref:rhodanese-like domain-containing protein n=1 Tax=Mycobacterium sp. IDR2000157661 TaxID=2867005 RepID=UPI001EED3542|nr:rhodanese-like domain-containing protein [Mycobacterium sp. IDR2000157661]ULE34675.1 rhodanese-like domain-containing protein [Mycobacterium sp. IDR2000157661]